MKFAASLVKRSQKYHTKMRQDANILLESIIRQAKKVLKPARLKAEAVADEGFRYVELRDGTFCVLTEAIRIYKRHPFNSKKSCETALSQVFDVKSSITEDGTVCFEWDIDYNADEFSSTASSSASDEAE